MNDTPGSEKKATVPDSPTPEQGTSAAVEDSASAEAQPKTLCCGMWGMLAAGLLGGLLAGPAVHRFAEHFKMVPITAEIDAISRADSSDPRLEPYFRQRTWDALWRNVALNFALVGVALGGVIGLAAGLSRKSLGGGIAGLLLGIVLGGVFGAAGGWCAAAVWESISFHHLRFLDPGPRQVQHHSYAAMATHAAGWAILGGGLGVIVSLAAFKKPVVGRFVLAGGVAGLIAAAMYAPVASIVFPMQKSDLPIPLGAGNQFFFAMLAGALYGIFLGRAGGAGSKEVASS